MDEEIQYIRCRTCFKDDVNHFSINGVPACLNCRMNFGVSSYDLEVITEEEYHNIMPDGTVYVLKENGLIEKELKYSELKSN